MADLMTFFGYHPLFSNVMYDHFSYLIFFLIILLLQFLGFGFYNFRYVSSEQSPTHYIGLSGIVFIVGWIISVTSMLIAAGVVSDQEGYTSFILWHATGFILLSLLMLILVIPITYFFINPK